MKLYRLKNRIGDWYVIAGNPTEAEAKLMKFLDDSDCGFYVHRIVTEFYLIATESEGKRFITDHFLLT